MYLTSIHCAKHGSLAGECIYIAQQAYSTLKYTSTDTHKGIYNVKSAILPSTYVKKPLMLAPVAMHVVKMIL